VQCYKAIAKHFGSKSPRPALPAQPADDRFGQMLAAELKSVNNTSIKRDLKKKLLACVLDAQEQEEQLQQTAVQ